VPPTSCWHTCGLLLPLLLLLLLVLVGVGWVAACQVHQAPPCLTQWWQTRQQHTQVTLQ
jgi:hypothetical protein